MISIFIRIIFLPIVLTLITASNILEFFIEIVMKIYESTKEHDHDMY